MIFQMERKHQFQMQLRLILNLSARPINTYKINLKSLKSPSTLKLKLRIDLWCLKKSITRAYNQSIARIKCTINQLYITPRQILLKQKKKEEFYFYFERISKARALFYKNKDLKYKYSLWAIKLLFCEGLIQAMSSIKSTLLYTRT